MDAIVAGKRHLGRKRKRQIGMGMRCFHLYINLALDGDGKARAVPSVLNVLSIYRSRRANAKFVSVYPTCEGGRRLWRNAS